MLSLATVSCSSSDDSTVNVDPNPNPNPNPEPEPEPEPVTAKFKHRVLVEDFTGIWCGWCPRVAHGIDLLKETPEADNYVFGAIHNGDVLTISGTGSLATSLWTKFQTPSNQRGYPFAAINRSTTWKYPEPNNLNQVKNLVQAAGVPVGIKISSTLTPTGGSINFGIKMGQTMTGLKYVCYVVENGITKPNNPQENYTDYYGGADLLPNFVHNDAFLKSTGALAGTAISDATTSGTEINYTGQSITYTSHTNNIENIEVVVMVLNDKNDVINVRKAKANATVDYEQL